MHRSGDSIGEPELDYETWRVVLRSLSGRYNPEGIEPSVFAGWVRPVSVCGFTVLDIGANAQRIRAGQDEMFASMAWSNTLQYFKSLVARRLAKLIRSRHLRLTTSHSSTRAVLGHTCQAMGTLQWNCLSIPLPRQSLVSHLGFEPQGGICRRGTLAGRLLLDIIRNARQR